MYIMYYHLCMYYVRYSLTYLPTQKLDILYERSLIKDVQFRKNTYPYFICHKMQVQLVKWAAFPNRILISILKKSTVKKNNSYFSADELASEFFINTDWNSSWQNTIGKSHYASHCDNSNPANYF